LLPELLVLEVLELDPELLLPGVVAAPWLVLDQLELPDEFVIALLFRPLLLPVLYVSLELPLFWSHPANSRAAPRITMAFFILFGLLNLWFVFATSKRCQRET
jgi:hypothetical protein